MFIGCFRDEINGSDSTSTTCSTVHDQHDDSTTGHIIIIKKKKKRYIVKILDLDVSLFPPDTDHLLLGIRFDDDGDMGLSSYAAHAYTTYIQYTHIHVQIDASACVYAVRTTSPIIPFYRKRYR